MKVNRSINFQRDDRLIKTLELVNNHISNFEFPIQKDSFSFPPIFLMGCARCGSTIFFQCLANSNLFAYPTNLISRFYKNPHFGALVQKILLEYDFNNQIFKENSKNINLISELGHTSGPLAPNEFWYFWREYFQFNEIQKLSRKELEEVDTKSFINHLISLETLYKKPLALKGMILNWHIPFLYEKIPNAIFIYLKREPLYQAQSIYLSRLKFFNDENGWWSFKPPEYHILKKENPLKQVAGQVFYTNKAIELGLKKIPNGNKIIIDYEVFCESPEYFLRKVLNTVLPKNIEVSNYKNNKILINQNTIKLPKKDIKKIRYYLNSFIENS